MFQFVHKVRPEVWLLLGGTASIAVVATLLRATKLVEASTLFYYVLPAAWLVLAGLAYALARGRRDRLRHKTERMFLVVYSCDLVCRVLFIRTVFYVCAQCINHRYKIDCR
mgnify:CR=1 FL=1